MNYCFLYIIIRVPGCHVLDPVKCVAVAVLTKMSRVSTVAPSGSEKAPCSQYACGLLRSCLRAGGERRVMESD